jgi:CHAT domain-containing protein
MRPSLRVVNLAPVLAALSVMHLSGGMPNSTVFIATPTQNQTSLPTLTQGVTFSREIGGNISQSYEIRLAAGQYLGMSIAKLDLQLIVTIFGPSGKKSLEVENRRYGPLLISLIADEPGSYRLDLRSLEKDAADAHYALSVDEIRPSTTTDRQRESAYRNYAEAEMLRAGSEEKLFREAIKRYATASTEWLSIGQDREAAQALEDAGDTHFTLSEYKPALASYDKALEISRGAHDPLGEMNALNSIGYVYVYLGDNERAMGHFQSVLDYCKKINADNKKRNDQRLEAQALNNMGEVYYSLSDHRKALGFFQHALAAWQSTSDRRGLALAEINIGYSYYDLGDIEEASKHYQQSLQWSRKIDDQRGEALALTALGGVYSFLGEKQRALESHNQAMLLFRKIGDHQGEAATLNGTGKAYEDLNEHQTALDSYNHALTLYKQIGNRDYEALTNYYVGRVYRLMENIPQALLYYDRCVALSRKVGSRRFEAYALKDIGIIYNSLGHRPEALSRFEDVLVIYQQLQDRRGQAYTLNSIGYTHYLSGALPESLGYFREALALSRAAMDRQGEISILYNLAQAERGQANLSEALSAIKESITIIEALRTKVESTDLRASYFASVHQHYELYIDLLMLMYKQTSNDDFAAAALEACEESRARSLLERLAQVKIDEHHDVAPSLLERKRSLEKSLDAKAEYQMRLLNGKHTDEMAAEIGREIHELSIQYAEVQAQIRSQSPGYAIVTQPQLLQFKDIQAVVQDDDTLLLEYALGAERSYLWVVSRSKVTAYELPKRVILEEASTRVHDLLIARQPVPGESASQYQKRVASADSGYGEAAAALGQMLLGQIASQLGTKRLLISSDGALQYIPFEALSVPGRRDGPALAGDAAADGFAPLILDHEIVNLPSVSVLAALRHETLKPTTKTVIVLADPIFERGDPRLAATDNANANADKVTENLKLSRVLIGVGELESNVPITRLPSTLREAKAILAVTPAGQGKMVTGFEANRALAMSPELGQYRIVHFATHGIVDGENPELSGLILSRLDRQGNQQDGFLHLRDIYDLDLNADLVVLSACRTGLGKSVKGEGLVGLTQGFMYAGARSMVGSLWKVDDEATAELMGRFYAGMLKDEMSPAAALRAAKVAMWRQKRWRSPYYWSAFVLQGEYKRLPGSNGHFRRFIYPILAVTIMLVSIAVGYYVFRLARRRGRT